MRFISCYFNDAQRTLSPSCCVCVCSVCVTWVYKSEPLFFLTLCIQLKDNQLTQVALEWKIPCNEINALNFAREWKSVCDTCVKKRYTFIIVSPLLPLSLLFQVEWARKSMHIRLLICSWERITRLSLMHAVCVLRWLNIYSRTRTIDEEGEEEK